MATQGLTAPVLDETPPASRRERRKLEVRRRIIEAAISLFDEQGFHATNVEEIAERADVAYKTFFNHFPSKQDLLQVIAREQLDALLAMLDEAASDEKVVGLAAPAAGGQEVSEPTEPPASRDHPEHPEHPGGDDELTRFRL